jgi:hypothetical protein
MCCKSNRALLLLFAVLFVTGTTTTAQDKLRPERLTLLKRYFTEILSQPIPDTAIVIIYNNAACKTSACGDRLLGITPNLAPLAINKIYILTIFEKKADSILHAQSHTTYYYDNNRHFEKYGFNSGDQTFLFVKTEIVSAAFFSNTRQLKKIVKKFKKHIR